MQSQKELTAMYLWRIFKDIIPDLLKEYHNRVNPSRRKNIDIITDESLDMIVSIALPGLMVLLTLPITLTRYKVQKVNDIHLRASPRYLSFHKPKVMS